MKIEYGSFKCNKLKTIIKHWQKVLEIKKLKLRILKLKENYYERIFTVRKQSWFY